MSTGPDAPIAAPASTLAVAFVRALRRAGVPVPTTSTVSFSEALASVGLAERDPAYWAGRATLVRRREDVDTYDRLFAAFWESTGFQRSQPSEADSITLAVDTDEDDSDDDSSTLPPDDEERLEMRFSRVEVLRHKDFADYDADELDEARRLMARFRLVGEPRRSLRLTPGDGHRPDLRRTVRAALAADGEPIRRHWRRRSEKPRRLVLLLDVSGSMEPYARALVRFAHAAVVGRQRVEVFALGTRLTRITRELSERDPDTAVNRAGQTVVDWSGGTRIGDGLREFNDRWGQRGMARGAIVVVLSDGWDRGDPAVLDEQLTRLKRLTHRLVWVNPLKVTPGYAPLARGMATALPHLDDFVEGHSVDALDRLGEIISGRSARRGARRLDQTESGSPTGRPIRPEETP